MCVEIVYVFEKRIQLLHVEVGGTFTMKLTITGKIIYLTFAGLLTWDALMIAYNFIVYLKTGKLP